MRYIIGVLVLFFTTFFAIAQFGGGIANYINLPTIALFLLVIIGVIITKGGFKTLVAAVNALLSKKYSISAAEQEKAIRLFKLLSKSVLYAMILLTLISVVNMLMGMDWNYYYTDPLIFVWMFFSNFAAALISVFYGLLINMALINPAISILESRHNADIETMLSEKRVMDKLLELCCKQGISPEEILGAGEISFGKEI